FCYLVVLNEKFLTQLASYLLRQIEQVLSEIGIILNNYLNNLKNKIVLNQIKVCIDNMCFNSIVGAAQQ
ncbi:hypothetical protein C3B51_21395, partial [Pseudoalteromonas rubra]